MRVILTAAAVEDLTSIRAYIAEDSPKAAERFARRLVETCESLGSFPKRGRAGLEPGTRENVAVWPYVIAYREGVDVVEILHIWHGAQDRR